MIRNLHPSQTDNPKATTTPLTPYIVAIKISLTAFAALYLNPVTIYQGAKNIYTHDMYASFDIGIYY